MKLNLLMGAPGDVRSGYLNVDPLADGGDGRVDCKLDDLSPVVDANECQEIVALDVVDRFSTAEADAAMSHWLSRLARGGTLAVGCVDVGEVARLFRADLLSLEDVNTLLHGEQDGPGRFRLCSLTLARLAAALEGKGMKIMSRRVTDCHAVVVCRRP